jgi:hypothetical protein
MGCAASGTSLTTTAVSRVVSSVFFFPRARPRTCAGVRLCVEDRGQLRSSGFGISESRFILFLPKFNLANLKMQSGKLK